MKKTSKVNVKNPGQTKSSIQRQLLAAEKRLKKTSLVPDEALYCVFEYLDISDLLRCCVVCMTWKSVAEIPALWQKGFRRLPKQIQDISTKAKTTGHVDWKKECIYCAKERRNKIIQRLQGSNTLESTVKKKSEATRALKIKWLLQFQEKSSEMIYEVFGEEDFIFCDHSLNVRWNHFDVPAFSKLKLLKLYAISPLFFRKNMAEVKNSVYTRSLLYSKTFKGSNLQSLRYVQKDDHVTVHSMGNLYFGLWNSSLPNIGDIAFVGYTIPQENLLLKSMNGSSEGMWIEPVHKIVSDDVDPNYGLHGYTLKLCLRNSRKLFWFDSYEFVKDGIWVEQNNWLLLEWSRQEDYVFYDIKEKLNFTWKTTALKGSIENLVILDLILIDVNKETAWNFSVPVAVTKINDEPDNYSYENCEIWELQFIEDPKKCIIRIIKDSETDHSTILSIQIMLKKSFFNTWFGCK